MDRERVKQIIEDELPGIVERDSEVRDLILRLAREHFADRRETESRFDRVLDELRHQREESARRWEEHLRESQAFREEQARKWEEHLREFQAFREEQARKWEEHLREFRAFQEEQARKWEEHLRESQAFREEQSRKWEEHLRESQAFREEQARKWEEQKRQWEEQKRQWEEQSRRWEEQKVRWEEQEKRWAENSARIDRILDTLAAQARKHDQSIGALGARWGVQTEESFRNALAGILGDMFGMEVTHFDEHDEEGVVFGHPAQVELDLMIKDGKLILGEIKSSISSEEMYALWRKARFYEEKYGRRADRLVVISPMVEPKAREVAKKLGIEVYSYAEDAGTSL